MIDRLSVTPFKKLVSLSVLSLVFVLTSCGGGGGGDSTPTSTSQSITGSGVKGPLTDAVVTVFAFDAEKPESKGNIIDTGITDGSAAIIGLSLPLPLKPPYIMEFSSNANTRDMTTKAPPVITKMRTVITGSMLARSKSIYTTPLTTMAVDIAVASSGAGTTAAQFEAELTAAASEVVSTLGFGMDGSIDIFDTPPLVDSTTTSADQQANVAAYRAAVEAVTAIAYQIGQQSATGDTDSVLSELAADLADGGGIDGSAGTLIDANTLQVLEQDPATLPIPNSPTNQTVADVQAILVTEATVTSPATPVTELDAGGSITTTTEPAETNPDLDNDTVLNADDAFPENGTETADADGDGIGDNADPDDNNDGILDVDEGLTPTPAATDVDVDGIDDGVDNCVGVYNPTQTNTDDPADAEGDACDLDDDQDGVPDASDVAPLNALLSTDNDGDGLEDTTDDLDDDNDGLSDVDEGIAGSNPLVADTDGDGVFDGADFAPTDNTVTYNFAPVATDSSVTTDEDVAVAIVLDVVDDDVAVGPLVYAVSAPSNGVLSGTEPNLTYKPNSEFSGSDSFTFTVEDSDNKISSVTTVSITVNEINDVPVISQASPIAVVMDEDGVPTAFVAPAIDATDAEGDTLSWSLSGAAANGSATVSGIGASPTVTYMPNLNFSGLDSFEATVSDGNGGSDAVVINVTVNEQNDVPIIAQTGPLVVVMDEDGLPTAFVAPTISATDIDSGLLSWSGTAANNGTATVTGSGASPTITYVPDADFNGSDSFDVLVNDGVANSSITVNVAINAQNDVPVIEAVDPISIAEDVPDATLVATLTATDVDGTVQGYNITGGNTDDAFAIDSSGQITVADTSVIDFDSGVVSYNLLVRASDGISPSDAAVVVVNITDVNDTAPVVGAAGPFAIDEDAINTAAVGSVSATDADGVGGVTGYSITAGDAGGAFAISVTGDITVADTNAIDYESDTSFTLTITATDGVTTPSAGVMVVVDVNDVNDTAPVVGAGQSFNVIDSATSGDPVGTVSANDDDTVGSITGFTISGTVFAIDAGGQITVLDDSTLLAGSPYTVSVDATDGTNISSAENVTITVVSNAPPVIDQTGPLSVTMDEDEFTQAFVAPAISATDAEGDSLNWSATDPANGFVDIFGTGVNAPTFISYTPFNDFNGEDSFVVNVTDGTSTVGITINVTVNSVNDAPFADFDDAGTVNEDTLLVTLDVRTNDSDIDVGDTLTASTLTGFSDNGGTVVANPDGTFNYTSALNYNGFDSFDYTITDVGGLTSISSVQVEVLAVNDAPVAADDTETAIVDVALITGDVLFNDTDVDSSLTITISDITSANGGTVSYNGNGIFTYTSASDYTGADSFTYTVSDGEFTDVGTVNITVTAAGTPIAMTTLFGEGNLVGIDDNGPDEYAYWTDSYDAGTELFTFEDKEFNHLTATFETFNESDLLLNAAGDAWVSRGNIYGTVSAGDANGLDLSIRDANNNGDVLASFKLTARVVDLEGQSVQSYLPAAWQGAMFDTAKQFSPGAKLISEYKFEVLTDSYWLWTDNWCQDDGTTRYDDLNGNCDAIDLNGGGYATTLTELVAGTAWVGDDNVTQPPGAIQIAWGNNTTLMAQLVSDNTVNYYVVDHNQYDTVDYVSDPVAGTNWVQTGTGVTMYEFTIPEFFVAQFPDELDEGLTHFVTVQNGFVRKGDKSVTNDIELDSGMFSATAFNDIITNFSGDNYTQAIEGTTIYDIYQDTGINEYLIDGITFDSATTFSTYDYPDIGSTETGAWDVSATGVLHMTMTSGPDAGDEWWSKVKFVNPDNGVNRTCYASSAAGPFNCTFLDVGMGTTSKQTNDLARAEIIMDKRNSFDPQISQARKPNLVHLDGSRSATSGVWIGEFDTASLTTGTHTLDIGEGDPIILTLDPGGTGTVEFSPTETNTITAWSVDFNGVLRFTETATNLTFGNWVIGNFDAVVPGNVLVQHIGTTEGFFVMGGFDKTLTVFDAAALAGTTQYNVYYCDDCSEPGWILETLVFDADGETLTLSSAGDLDEVGTYVVNNGILEIFGGAEFIEIISLDDAIGASLTCWKSTATAPTDCSGLEVEYFFDDLTNASTFLDSLTFAGTPINASVVLAGGGVYEFYDDAEFDETAGVDLPGYWNLAYDDSTIVDQESLWSIALNRYLPAVLEQGIILTSTGWQLADDITDNIILSGNTATLEAYEPGTTTVVNSVNVSFEAMDISGGVQGHYVSTGLLNDDSAIFASGAQWLNASYTQNLGTTEIGHWTDCGEPDLTDRGGNCNIVWIRAIDGANNVDTALNPAVSIAEFHGVLNQTLELGWNKYGNGNLVGVFDGDSGLDLYVTDFFGPATFVGTGSYMVTNENTETFIDYTLPAGFEDMYGLFYEAVDGETGILAVHDGLLRHGEREPVGSGNVFLFNDVAGADVIANVPVAPVVYGTWVATNWTDPTAFLPDFVTFFANDNYVLQGGCSDLSLTSATGSILGGENAAGMEVGPYTWDSVSGDYVVSPVVDTNGFCLLNDAGDNAGTMSASGDVLTITDSSETFTFDRVKISVSSDIVGSWVLSEGDKTVVLYFFDNGYYTESQSCLDNEFGGVPEAIAGGLEYGTYSWNDVSGDLTGNVVVDTDGWCGLHDNNDGGTAIAPINITIDGDVMTIQPDGEPPVNAYRIQ